MLNKISIYVSFGILLTIFALSGKATSLLGTSVTGSLEFTGDPSNYFDPGYGFVPSGYSNGSGITVTIANNAIEFGYNDGFSLISADFSANQLTVSDLAELSGTNNAFQMTFSDLSFAGQYMALASGTLPLDGFSISGDTITLNYLGGTAVEGQTLTSVFNIAQIPEPSSLGLLGISALGLLIAPGRRIE